MEIFWLSLPSINLRLATRRPHIYKYTIIFRSQSNILLTLVPKIDEFSLPTYPFFLHLHKREFLLLSPLDSIYGHMITKMCESLFLNILEQKIPYFIMKWLFNFNAIFLWHSMIKCAYTFTFCSVMLPYVNMSLVLVSIFWLKILQLFNEIINITRIICIFKMQRDFPKSDFGCTEHAQ